jgi:DHA2 family multidrug resistance protein
MEETLNANSADVQAYIAGLGRAVGDPAVGLRLLSQQISAEALTMTYNDIFWIMGMGTFCVLPLVLFLRPLPKGAKPATVH